MNIEVCPPDRLIDRCALDQISSEHERTWSPTAVPLSPRERSLGLPGGFAFRSACALDPKPLSWPRPWHSIDLAMTTALGPSVVSPHALDHEC
jgi:hypothetical protein